MFQAVKNENIPIWNIIRRNREREWFVNSHDCWICGTAFN